MSAFWKKQLHAENMFLWCRCWSVLFTFAVQCWSFFAGKFNWKGTIKAVLRQSPDEGIAVKKLRKKVTPLWVNITKEICGSGSFPLAAFLGLFGKRMTLVFIYQRMFVYLQWLQCNFLIAWLFFISVPVSTLAGSSCVLFIQWWWELQIGGRALLPFQQENQWQSQVQGC